MILTKALFRIFTENYKNFRKISSHPRGKFGCQVATHPILVISHPIEVIFRFFDILQILFNSAKRVWKNETAKPGTPPLGD